MNEATWTPVRPDCDTTRWSAPDNMGSESEVSEFLAALVRLLHPDRVLETGTYLGFTAARIGKALKNQGYGHLDSLEVDPSFADQARLLCLGLPVTIYTTDSLDFTPQGEYDLMFFDSSITARAGEMARFRRFASPRCVWVLHDSRNVNLKSLGGLQLPTPRGLALGRFT